MGRCNIAANEKASEKKVIKPLERINHTYYALEWAGGKRKTEVTQ